MLRSAVNGKEKIPHPLVSCLHLKTAALPFAGQVEELVKLPIRFLSVISYSRELP